MQGNDTKLKRFLDGVDKRFVIPVYQRNYNWGKKNWEQLYNDIIKAADNTDRQYFLGSIVFVSGRDGDKEILNIIDGQQRLTTVSLLFLATYHLLEKGYIHSANPNLVTKLCRYLVDYDAPAETKLILKSEDHQAYCHLLQDDIADMHNQKRRVLEAYKYFYERIQKNEVNPDRLVTALENFVVISVSLKTEEDDPQLIFESLNSTGLALTESDKVRNFVLMDLEPRIQEQLYNKYWRAMEDLVKSDDLTKFIKDYLIIKNNRVPDDRDTYFEFKKFVSSHQEMDKTTLLQDLYKYAQLYAELNRYEDIKIIPTSELHECVFRLAKLDYTVIRPLLLELLNCRNDKKVTEVNVSKIFRVLESYLFRRLVCDLPSNTLKKTFLRILKELKSDDISIDSLIYILLGRGRSDSSRFPDDDEFAIGFAQKNFYQMQPNSRLQYTLERLEQAENREHAADIWRGFNRPRRENPYTIEHIMPQTLTEEWEEELGATYNEIHNNWVDKIANLTISAYNQEYSNRLFKEKKTCKHGFAESRLELNRWICENTPDDKWGEEQLRKRSQKLTDIAQKTWPRPNIVFESVSLDIADVGYLTNRLLQKFSYKNKEYDIRKWGDMYITIIKILHQKNPTILLQLCSIAENQHIVSKNKANLVGAKQVDEKANIYVTCPASTAQKIERLKWFFAQYNIDPVDLVFYLRERN